MDVVCDLGCFLVFCVSQLVDFNISINLHTHIKGAKEPKEYEVSEDCMQGARCTSPEVHWGRENTDLGMITLHEGMRQQLTLSKHQPFSTSLYVWSPLSSWVWVHAPDTFWLQKEVKTGAHQMLTLWFTLCPRQLSSDL